MHYIPTTFRVYLKQHGFSVRLGTYLRVCGDGVIQIVRFEKTRNGHLELAIGLASMYSNLCLQNITSVNRMLKYSIMNIAGIRWLSYREYDKRSKQKLIDYQISYLMNTGMTWLDSINTQEKLSEGLLFLESSWGGSIVWNDRQKIAPYLCVEDYCSAERVISAILEQHKIAAYYKKSLLTKERYEAYQKQSAEKYEIFQWLNSLIAAKDVEGIRRYLDLNYHNNYVSINRLYKVGLMQQK